MGEDILFLTGFLLLLSSGSAVGSFRFQRRFEELLPVTCMVMVLLLFLFGLAGCLASGVYVLLTCAATAWVFGLVALLRSKDRGVRLRCFFSTNFFLYTAAFFYLYLLNRGRLASSFDEMSHWADVVKLMAQLDVLSTDPRAHATFSSYPPGISLFLYLEEKLRMLLQHDATFVDWTMFHAFQSFVAALLLPFLKALDYRNFYAWAVAVACILAPNFLFDELFLTILVDPVLGILTAAGFASLVLHEENSLSRWFVLLCAAMLTLAKPVGAFFGLCIAVAWAVADRIRSGRPRLQGCAGALAVLLPWGLWQASIHMHGAVKAFSNPVEPGLLIQILTGADDSYRSTVRDNFLLGLNEIESSGAFLGLKLSYPVLVSGLFVFLLLVCQALVRQRPEKRVLVKFVLLIQVFAEAVYIFGLLVMYLFKFGEYEAIQLASFQRYMAIPLQGVWMLSVLLFVGDLQERKEGRLVRASLLLVTMLALVPSRVLISLTNRMPVASSQELRAPYDQLFEAFDERFEEEEARLYLISQGGSEYQFYLIRFCFRPYWVDADEGWRVDNELAGTSVWPRICSAGILRERLLDAYDFLILQDVDDTFLTECVELFSDPADIGNGGIFRLNRETGLLDRYNNLRCIEP